MDALFQFFPAHYGIHRVAATLHFSEYRLRERDRSCGVLTPAECHAIVIEGKAELIDNAEINATLPAYAEKYTPLLNEMGMSPEAMAADYSQAIRITPAKFMIVS